MYLHLGLLPIWPDWCGVEKTMPKMFRKSYPDTFIIIDATEIKCESLSNLFPQSQHQYKSLTTLKGLVGIVPNGFFTLVSQLFIGSISDKELVIQRDVFHLLDMVPPGKCVMAGRGFEI